MRLATSAEVAVWNRWLWNSHDLPYLSDAVIYFCHLDCPMLLTPWRRFDDLAVRVERCVDAPIMTFRLDGSTRTIAQFWSIPSRLQEMPLRRLNLMQIEARMAEAAADGEMWWGIEFPPESTLTTSYLRWLPREFSRLTAAKEGLDPAPPPEQPLETCLDLI